MPPRTVRELRPRARRAMVRAQKKALEKENDTGDTVKGSKKNRNKLQVEES